MAIQIDYFPAPSDEVAAATVNLADGVRGQYEDGSPIADDAPLALSQDVDPGLGLGYLYQVLTQTPLETYLDEFTPELIAASDDEQKFVLSVPAAVVGRLAEPFTNLDETVQAWADVEAPADADEWNPHPRDLKDFLTDFQHLAQTAHTHGDNVYCWLWP